MRTAKLSMTRARSCRLKRISLTGSISRFTRDNPDVGMYVSHPLKSRCRRRGVDHRHQPTHFQTGRLFWRRGRRKLATRLFSILVCKFVLGSWRRGRSLSKRWHGNCAQALSTDGRSVTIAATQICSGITRRQTLGISNPPATRAEFRVASRLGRSKIFRWSSASALPWPTFMRPGVKRCCSSGL